jgi:hypothetical protein
MSGAALLTVLALALPQDPPGPGVTPSTTCAECHSSSPSAVAMRDSQGAAVAPYDLWRSSMMANASRDPLWRAAVSAEVAATPSRRAEIEEKCMSCHAPMGHRVGLESHETDSLLHLLDCVGQKAELARDGVSCTICHGISPEGLGTPATFSGKFELDPWRRIFGPHEDPFLNPMRMRSGFTPTHGEHVVESRLCGSCHTLETHAFDADGAAREETFLEQAVYLEWRNSAFVDEGDEEGELARSCQDCHLPTHDEHGVRTRTTIARNPGGRDFPRTVPRRPFGRHLLVGGNTLVLSMFRDHGEELGAAAPREAFEATLAATREQLQERTAAVEVEAHREEGRLEVSVGVRNLTGHKLPTGHPTRRAWLRLLVRDGSGTVLFSSGATDDAGRLLGADGAPLPSELAGGPVPPHRDVVRAADEVPIYEAVMADADGAPTFTLLRGTSWLRDDRLLPEGWSAEHPEAPRTAPVGTAGDTNFVGGGDRVRYELSLDAEGPLSIEASLLYQPLGARWAAELLQVETPEMERFGALYEAAERGPEVLAEARATLP